MKTPVYSVSDIGLVLRAVRRASQVRLDDLAACAGVSNQFASDLEHGKPTVRLGLVLQLMAELGVTLTLDIPAEAQAELEALRAKGGLIPRPSRKVVALPPGNPENKD